MNPARRFGGISSHGLTVDRLKLRGRGGSTTATAGDGDRVAEDVGGAVEVDDATVLIASTLLDGLSGDGIRATRLAPTHSSAAAAVARINRSSTRIQKPCALDSSVW